MNKSPTNNLTYQQAGVNIDAGNALVDLIKPAAKRTNRPGVMDSLGGFGALFDLKAAGFNDPLLVSCTDGVGTKLKLGIETGMMNGLGIDLVAMCVNDLVVQGATPLFFLDYYATGALNNEHAAAIINSIADGCQQANCALIGGETAEMPGMYQANDFDLAGFCVGAVDRDKVITGKEVAAGDVLIGLPSSGVHSNGFSLVRAILQRTALSLHSPAPWDSSKKVGEALLEPTKIYVKECLAAIKTGKVKALSHITGGGLLENIPRVLPDDLSVSLNNLPEKPSIFECLQKMGNVVDAEMYRVFNMGIGMVLIVDADAADKICKLTGGQVIGVVEKGIRQGKEVLIEA